MFQPFNFSTFQCFNLSTSPPFRGPGGSSAFLAPRYSVITLFRYYDN